MVRSVRMGQSMRYRRGRALSSPTVNPLPLFDRAVNFQATGSQGTLIAKISNPTPGDTYSISPDDGVFQFNGTRLERGPTPVDIGTLSHTIIRTPASGPQQSYRVPMRATRLDYGLGAIYGASLEANNHSSGGTSTSNAFLFSAFNAPVIIANALTGGAVKFPASWARPGIGSVANLARSIRGANQGYGSKTTATIEVVMSENIPLNKAGLCLASPGRNGIPQVPMEQAKAEYLAGIAVARSEGCIIGHIGLSMREAWAEGSSSWLYAIELDQFLRDLATDNNEWYFNTREAMHLDGAPSPWTIDTAKLTDGTHYNTAGGYAVAQAYGAQLANYYDTSLDPTEWPDNSAKLLDPLQNTIANPYMTGTGGTKANGATGTVADGYYLQAQSGGVCTVVGSIVVGPDGRNRQRITITPPASGTAYENILLRLNPNKFGATGGVFERGMDVYVVQAGNGFIKASPRSELAASPDMSTTIANKFTADFSNPQVAMSFRDQGACMEYPASASTTIALDIQVRTDGTVPIIVETTGWFYGRFQMVDNYPAGVLTTQNNN